MPLAACAACRVTAPPRIKLDRKLAARDMKHMDLAQVIGSDLLLRAAALDDCLDSRHELDRLVARVAFGA